MAKKFFNKRVNSRKKTLINSLIIGGCIIGIILCFWLTQNLGSTDTAEPTEVIVKLQESVSVDLNNGEPESDVYFLELSGVTEDDIIVDYSNVDFSKLGSYNVTVTVLNELYYVSLVVVDVSKPELTLASVTIEEGESYKYTDFLISCVDNSNEECEISFYTGNVDQDGNSIDYSKYTDSGTYDIVIIATDVNGNSTYETTSLTIGEEEESTPTECTYGNTDYNSGYILSYSVSSNGCAISLDLYQNSAIREPMDDIADTEANKIKTEIDQISGLSSNIIINRSITAILNETGNGFVGYSLYMEVTNNDGEILVSYYLTESGSRIYINNPYELS